MGTANAAEPAVSVIITSYNRERVIGDAIRSILRQSMTDFELIVVDDGSRDTTVKVVESFDDRRIRLVRHDANRGIPAARNSGVEAARGRFIAWLDSDDVARPNRIEVQLAYLHDNPATALIGSCAGKIDERGQPLGATRHPPFSHQQICAWLLFRSAFQQSSVFGRAAVLKRFPYRAEFPVCEDIDVFIRLSRDHRLENLPQVLIDRRIHPLQSVSTWSARVRERKAALQSELLDELGVEWSPIDLERHVALGSGSSGKAGLGAEFLQWAQAWLEQLVRANEVSRIYDRGALRFACAYFWTAACRHIGGSAGDVSSLGQICSSPVTTGWLTPNAAQWLARAARASLKKNEYAD